MRGQPAPSAQELVVAGVACHRAEVGPARLEDRPEERRAVPAEPERAAACARLGPAERVVPADVLARDGEQGGRLEEVAGIAERDRHHRVPTPRRLERGESLVAAPARRRLERGLGLERAAQQRVALGPFERLRERRGQRLLGIRPAEEEPGSGGGDDFGNGRLLRRPRPDPLGQHGHPLRQRFPVDLRHELAHAPLGCDVWDELEGQHEAQLVERGDIDRNGRRHVELLAFETEWRHRVALGHARGEDAPGAGVGRGVERRRRKSGRACQEGQQRSLVDEVQLEQRRVERAARLALPGQGALQVGGGGDPRFDQEGGEIERHGSRF